MLGEIFDKAWAVPKLIFRRTTMIRFRPICPRQIDYDKNVVFHHKSMLKKPRFFKEKGFRFLGF